VRPRFRITAGLVVFLGANHAGNAQKVRIGGLVRLTVRAEPAQKARRARKGRNPTTGEEITIAAKPASVDVRARR
jgi:nucleoid DNA-binding protein